VVITDELRPLSSSGREAGPAFVKIDGHSLPEARNSLVKSLTL